MAYTESYLRELEDAATAFEQDIRERKAAGESSDYLEDGLRLTNEQIEIVKAALKKD